MRAGILGVLFVLAGLWGAAAQAYTDQDSISGGGLTIQCSVYGNKLTCWHQSDDDFGYEELQTGMSLSGVLFQPPRTATLPKVVCVAAPAFPLGSTGIHCWNYEDEPLYGGIELTYLGIKCDANHDLIIDAGTTDTDGDGLADACDTDDDNDGDLDGVDNCPRYSNADQLDSDGDGLGNVCDPTPIGPDADADGITDAVDNCPSTSNADQLDTDGDSQGDACDADDDNDGVEDSNDSYPLDPALSGDSDGDGVDNSADNCPSEGDLYGYGVDSWGCPISPGDSDSDGYPDNQDACPNEGDMGYGVNSVGCPDGDRDWDGVPDSQDSCPDRGQEGYGVDSSGCPNSPPPQDSDSDGVTDDVDWCPYEGNPYGTGVDSNGCANLPDADGDGIPDTNDNCPQVSNSDQLDSNSDGEGDVCDADTARAKNDFGGDGKADVLMRNKNTGEWYMAELDGVSILGQSVVVGPFLNLNHKIVSTGDLDGDGDADILTRGTAIALVPGRFRVELTDGRTYTGAAWINTMSSSLSDEIVSTKDFNQDGIADVLLRNSSTGVWTLNLMNGTGAPAIGTLNATTDLAYTFKGDGDYDGNGYPDLLLRQDNGGDGSWMVVTLDGDTTIVGAGFPSNMAKSSLWQPAVTDKDFNGDGKADVLLRPGSGAVQQWFIYVMNGLSAPSDSGLINMATGNQWQIASDADFNGDGKADILLRSTLTGQWYGYLLNGKTINSSGLQAMINSKDWELKTIDDHNGDGKGDILLRDKVTGQWMLHLMDGLTVQQRTVLPILYSMDYELQNQN